MAPGVRPRRRAALTSPLHRTPLYEAHVRDEAKLAPFAGYELPIRFAGTLEEHEAVRTSVGAFDVSHLGTVFVDGPQAAEVIGASFTNDPAKLADGGAQYTLCCDEDGGVIDDLIVYRLREDAWLTVPNAANASGVVATLDAAARDRDATIRDESLDWAVIAVQGPEALGLVDRVLASLGTAGTPATSTASFGVAPIEVDGAHGWLARTGYTGEAGVEVVIPGAAAIPLWDALLAAEVVPCGLGARDTLRLEAGLPLHGNDLSRDVTPFDARLGWAVKLDRGAFQGSAALARAKEQGPSRRLWGLEVNGRRPAREGNTVMLDGRQVGQVTSGTLSPTLGRPIALAYLDADLGPEDHVTVDIRGNLTDAEVVRPPFLRR